MKKTLAFCAAVICALTFMFAGCSKTPDTEDFLQIKAYKAGNGTEAIEAVAARFRELNPDKQVQVDWNEDGQILRTEMPLGPSINTVDLYLAGISYFDMIGGGAITYDGVTYDCVFEPLTDVYNSPAYGETKLIKDKMKQSFADYYDMGDGTFYGAPWVGGVTGLIYNLKMFENYGWEVPVTTDELIALCDKIIATEAVSTNKNSAGQKIKITPFIYCMSDSYWQYVYYQWWAQYDGIEVFNNVFEGKNAAGEYNPDLVTTDGIRYTLQLVDTLIGTYKKETINSAPTQRDNVYCDPNLPFRSFTDVQSTFLYGEGARMNTMGATTAAMMPNGDWLENEMYANFRTEIENGTVAFRMMKTPVISALSNKTSFKNDAEHDKKLGELVRWIDGGKQGDKPSFATDADVKTVEEARGIISPQGFNVAHIPCYATAKDLAKDFIRFMYSDEGLRIFAEATRGITMPLECDYTGIEFSDFQKSKIAIEESSTDYAMITQKYPIRYKSGLAVFSNVPTMGTIESHFGVSNGADYMSPDEIFTKNYIALQQSWQRMMEDAGLLSL